MTIEDTSNIPKEKMPNHLAVIMDGNGRWAKSKGLPRLEGHRRGAKAVREVVENCRRLGLRYLTLFSFSTENWHRSEKEVSGLMKLFQQYLESDTQNLAKNGIRLRAVGNLEQLPKAVRESLHASMEATSCCEGMDLILALSYGGREEIVQATKRIASRVLAGELSVEEISNSTFSKNLWTEDIPDPDLLVRTSGEMRISNFLLWQLAYSEIVVTEKLWPEFDRATLLECLKVYAGRERRFGLTSEQIAKKVVEA